MQTGSKTGIFGHGTKAVWIAMGSLAVATILVVGGLYYYAPRTSIVKEYPTRTVYSNTTTYRNQTTWNNQTVYDNSTLPVFNATLVSVQIEDINESNATTYETIVTLCNSTANSTPCYASLPNNTLAIPFQLTDYFNVSIAVCSNIYLAQFYNFTNYSWNLVAVYNDHGGIVGNWGFNSSLGFNTTACVTLLPPVVGYGNQTFYDSAIFYAVVMAPSEFTSSSLGYRNPPNTTIWIDMAEVIEN